MHELYLRISQYETIFAIQETKYTFWIGYQTHEVFGCQGPGPGLQHEATTLFLVGGTSMYNLHMSPVVGFPTSLYVSHVCKCLSAYPNHIPVIQCLHLTGSFLKNSVTNVHLVQIQIGPCMPRLVKIYTGGQCAKVGFPAATVIHVSNYILLKILNAFTYFWSSSLSHCSSYVYYCMCKYSFQGPAKITSPTSSSSNLSEGQIQTIKTINTTHARSKCDPSYFGNYYLLILMKISAFTYFPPITFLDIFKGDLFIRTLQLDLMPVRNSST